MNKFTKYAAPSLATISFVVVIVSMGMIDQVEVDIVNLKIDTSILKSSYITDFVAAGFLGVTAFAVPFSASKRNGFTWFTALVFASLAGSFIPAGMATQDAYNLKSSTRDEQEVAWHDFMILFALALGLVGTAIFINEKSKDDATGVLMEKSNCKPSVIAIAACGFGAVLAVVSASLILVIHYDDVGPLAYNEAQLSLSAIAYGIAFVITVALGMKIQPDDVVSMICALFIGLFLLTMAAGNIVHAANVSMLPSPTTLKTYTVMEHFDVAAITLAAMWATLEAIKD